MSPKVKFLSHCAVKLTTPLPVHLTLATVPPSLPPTTPPRLSQSAPRSPLSLPVAREWAGVAGGAQERSWDVEQRNQTNTNTGAVKKKPGYEKQQRLRKQTDRFTAT
ncbi:hypothetical protein Pmani_002047 [Petrolisthes manimaculis]|uniref:Uncharacterized protein n=1 Tax=Petrolisthes manimaculis TaxID=1843537 RepID=A0AAE1QJD9_9EUCA|nr:hypothetical protein Pmani_002047 [Petrolisthes manimaculis]